MNLVGLNFSGLDHFAEDIRNKDEDESISKTKKPLFYLDNIFNNLLIFNMFQTNNIE